MTMYIVTIPHTTYLLTNPHPKRINLQNPLHLPLNPSNLLIIQTTKPRSAEIPHIPQQEKPAHQRCRLLVRMRDSAAFCFGVLDFIRVHLYGFHLAAEEEWDAGADVCGEGLNC